MIIMQSVRSRFVQVVEQFNKFRPGKNLLNCLTVHMWIKLFYKFFTGTGKNEIWCLVWLALQQMRQNPRDRTTAHRYHRVLQIYWHQLDAMHLQKHGCLHFKYRTWIERITVQYAQAITMGNSNSEVRNYLRFGRLTARPVH